MARALLTNKDFNLTISEVANIFDINRTSIYYDPVEKITTQEELNCKNLIDKIHTEHPAWGARQLSCQLQSQGYNVGRRKTRRYMLEMAIDAIFPGPNLSKRRIIIISKTSKRPFWKKSAMPWRKTKSSSAGMNLPCA